MATALLSVLLAACVGPASTFTVNGTVVDLDLQPMPGLEVYLGSAGTPQTTSADGTFTFAAVTPPYDVAVVDLAQDEVLVVRGLTRPDPTLQPESLTTSGREADLAGTISGASVGPSQMGAVLIGSASPGQGLADISSGTAFAGTYEWSGPPSVAVTLFGLVLDDNAGGPPSAFPAFGTSTTTLVDGSPATALDVPLVPIATAHLTGTATAAVGVPLDLLGALYTFRDGSHVATTPAITWSGTSPFDIALPDVPAASVTLLATGDTGSGDNVRWRTGLRAADSGVDLALVAPAALSTPVDGAVSVAQQGTFRWSATDDSVYLLMVNPDSTGPSVRIVTDQPEATLPDLSALGLSALPAGAAYIWNVMTLGRYASIDDASGPEGLLTNPYRVESGRGVPVLADGWYVVSAERSLTFAP